MFRGMRRFELSIVQQKLKNAPIRVSRSVMRWRHGQRESLPNRRDLHPFHDRISGSEFRVSLVSTSHFFSDYTEALAQALTAQGVTASAHEDFSSALSRQPHALVVVGIHLADLKSLKRSRRRSLLVGVQTEQVTSLPVGARNLGTDRLRKILPTLRHLDLVVDWHRTTVAPLSRKHPWVLHLPHGGFSTSTQPSDRPKSHDLVFIGGVPSGSRRAQILQDLSSRFSIYPRSHDLWGDEKWRAIDASRVVLNLHQERSQVFESPRFFEALGRKATLVSEGVFDPYPFRPQVDFVQTTTLRMASVIEELLSDETRMHSLGESGYERARAFSIDRSAQALLGHMLSAHRVILGH